MNLKANTVLNKIRQTLENELEGRNLQDVNLTEAEMKFMDEGAAVIQSLGYEMEGYEDSGPAAIAEALAAIAEEEGGDAADKVQAFLSQYQ